MGDQCPLPQRRHVPTRRRSPFLDTLLACRPRNRPIWHPQTQFHHHEHIESPASTRRHDDCRNCSRRILQRRRIPASRRSRLHLRIIDRDFFVVDFKCAGYERLVSNLVREVKAASNTTSVSNLALSSSQPHHHEDGWDDEQGVWRRLGEGEALPDDLAKELRDGERGVLRERTEEVGAGRKEGEKVVTSPFPFLDVASTLILQLSGE
jgi:hypothetical protein